MKTVTSGEDIKRCLCYGCYMNCGVLVHVANQRVTKVEGDPENPVSLGFVCERAVHSPEWVHHQDRLKYPLKRVGEKGEGKWERISWDQAFDEIAAKLTKIKEQYGAESIASSQGTGRTCDHIRRRFMNLLGSPNIFAPGVQVCGANVYVIDSITYGRGPLFADYLHSECILVWGGDPAQSYPPRWKAILEAKKRGAKLIVVDPRFTETASKADIWLQPRPATDTALLMGFMNIIINERLYDAAFVEKWTIGFDKLQERVQKYTPEAVAEITSVPAEKIRDAAKMYAINRPAGISWYVSLDQIGRNATQAVRARAILRAITGNLDVEGGMVLKGPHPKIISETEIEENEKLPLEQRKKQLGADKYKLFTWDIFDELLGYSKKIGLRAIMSSCYIVECHGPTAVRAMVTGNPYPVRALLTVASNPLVNFPHTKLVYEAIKSLDLFVHHDYFMTPTGMLADYVTPAATWLERPFLDLAFSNAQYALAGDVGIGPLHEDRTDFDFWRGIGIRMGQEWPWKNLEELHDYQLKPLGYTWLEFLKVGWEVPPLEYKKYEKTGFATPSGKVEIYSSILEKLGYDPLPEYEEPAEGHLSTPELAKEYPLTLIAGGKFRPMYHTEYRQVEWFRKMHPDPIVQINPELALELGIADGDWVWIETPVGRIKQKAKLFPGIDPKVVHAEHGWWFPEKPAEEPSLFGVWESNVNVLIDAALEKCDPMIGSWQLRNQMCKICKV
ncbi:molybdopterin-dependent oxidoreductase [Chloroflexota bacterium]